MRPGNKFYCNTGRFSHFASCFLLGALLFFSVSCSNLFDSTGVKSYLKEYTESAAVVSYALDSTYPTDTQGYTCLPSGADHAITLTLRNPQQYTLNIGYTLPSAAAAAVTSLISSGVTPIVTEQQSDTSIVKITLTDDYLTEMQPGGDITMTVTLTEPKSQRSFATYTIPLHANTPPPAADSMLVCEDSTGTSWILCFNMPGTDKTKKVHKDITTLTINNTGYAVSIDDSGVISFSDSSLTTTAPSLQANPTSGTTFTASTDTADAQSVYFITGDSVSSNTEKIYEITLTDSENFSTSAYATTTAFKLSAPAAADSSTGTALDTSASQSSPNTVTQNDDGTGTVTVSASAVTEEVTVNGVTVPSQQYDSSGAEVIYKVYNGSSCDTLYSSGTISGLSGSITLPAGVSKITALVRKSLYADSDTKTWYCKVKRTRVYVSSSGSDSNTGTVNDPVATVDYAVSLFDDTAASANTVYMLSNLTGQSVSSSSATFTLNGKGYSLTPSSGTAVTVSSSSDIVTLTNLTVVSGGITASAGTLTLSGSTVTAGGITASGAAVTLADSTVSAGGIAYTGGSLTLTGSTVITVPSSASVTTNDITLSSTSQTIAVSGLTASSVAKIKPSAYTKGITLLTGVSAYTDCARFSVTPDGTDAYVVDYVSASGYGILAQSGAAASIAIGSYTFTATSDADGSTSATSFANTASVYWIIKSGSTTIATYNTSSSLVTSTTTSLYSNGAAVLTSTGSNTTGTVSLSGMPAGSYRLYLKAVISGYTYDGYISITVTE